MTRSHRLVTHAVVIGTLLLSLILAMPVRGADGWASHYGPGTGVAMHFCTWTLRHTEGCGWVRIQSADTGLVAIAPVVDYCYCLVPDSAHPRRLVDLQYGVLAALGLPEPGSADDRGLYQVSVERGAGGEQLVPDTATVAPR